VYVKGWGGGEGDALLRKKALLLAEQILHDATNIAHRMTQYNTLLFATKQKRTIIEFSGIYVL
jgi:hypothetical protein